ncbi:MAG: rod shape-determining protein MreC [Chloroflexota bacterium]
MRRWRSNRRIFLAVCLVIAIGLIVGSRIGLLSPAEGLAAAPLNFISGIFNRISLAVSGSVGDLADIETLKARNADLETALVKFQSELVDLREIASDYQRLADLLDYTSTTKNQEYVTANVIANADPNSLLRTIVIDRGARDGITVGMPVVTKQGMVGRILNVTANAARVLLITDPTSAISGRLQTTRAEGSIVGQLSGDLNMLFIPLDATVQQGDLVITSGLGGNLPPDIVIGQVTSKRQFEFELYQEAVVRSLNNFDTLEIVLIITNFQPVDLSVFDKNSANGGQ